MKAVRGGAHQRRLPMNATATSWTIRRASISRATSRRRRRFVGAEGTGGRSGYNGPPAAGGSAGPGQPVCQHQPNHDADGDLPVVADDEVVPERAEGTELPDHAVPIGARPPASAFGARRRRRRSPTRATAKTAIAGTRTSRA